MKRAPFRPARRRADAGAESGPGSSEPSTPKRAALRRRLRYLRSLRELQLRDLGGLVFDLHRFRRQRHDLVVDKLRTLQATDAELRDLERAVGDPRVIRELREPGVGGACPTCRAYFPSDANYCANCGDHVAGDLREHATPDPATGERGGPATARTAVIAPGPQLYDADAGHGDGAAGPDGGDVGR
jgi:hypothetical protein